MSALQSDWSYAGLKGIIPSLLHYSLLGYNFFIPDAVGNRHLHIFKITSNPFIPPYVLSFNTAIESVEKMKAHSLGSPDSNKPYEVYVFVRLGYRRLFIQ